MSRKARLNIEEVAGQGILSILRATKSENVDITVSVNLPEGLYCFLKNEKVKISKLARELIIEWVKKEYAQDSEEDSF